MEGPVLSLTWEALTARVGQEIGVSAWTTIDQPMIDTFAKVTGDTHFIHVDPVRAAAVLPSKGTIAHGFYTLSLAPNCRRPRAPRSPRGRRDAVPRAPRG